MARDARDGCGFVVRCLPESVAPIDGLLGLLVQQLVMGYLGIERSRLCPGGASRLSGRDKHTWSPPQC